VFFISKKHSLFFMATNTIIKDNTTWWQITISVLSGLDSTEDNKGAVAAT
jgi:hypothetical protein